MKTRIFEVNPTDSLMRIACDAKVPVFTQSDVLVVEATLARCHDAVGHVWQFQCAEAHVQSSICIEC